MAQMMVVEKCFVHSTLKHLLGRVINLRRCPASRRKGIYWGYMGIMENKMETTIMGYNTVYIIFNSQG